MGFDGKITYTADMDAVWALMCDTDVAVARYQAAGDRDITVVEAGPDGDGHVMTTTRVKEVDLPGFAKKVLSPTNTMTQTDRWSAPAADGSRTGTWEVAIDGAPVSIEGTMSLRPDGDGVVHTIAGETTVKIPLVGKKIASWSEGTAREQVAAELAFNQGRLAG